MLVVRVFSCIAYAFCVVHSHSADDAERLHEHFRNSSKNTDIRPVFNQSQPVQVEICHYLTNVQNIDVSQGLVETTGIIQLGWKDEFHQWDPSLFGNITKGHLSEPYHWQPSIAVYANMKDGGEMPAFGLIYSNGQVVMVQEANLITRCQMDTFLFPFDSHSCTFEFYSTKYPAGELILQRTSNYILKFNFVENFEWEVINNGSSIVYVEDHSSLFAAIKYETNIIVKRRPTFFVLHQGMPSFLLTFLNMFTCLVPLNSGERLSYSVTIFLAFIFLMDTITKDIPVNSMSTSIASYAMVITNVTNSATVLISVLCVRMAGLDASEVNIPGILKKLVAWRQKSTNRVSSSKTDDASRAVAIQDLEVDVKTKPTDLVDETQPKQNKEKTDPIKNISWPDVANVLDGIYFKFLLLLLIVTNAIITVTIGTRAFS